MPGVLWCGGAGCLGPLDVQGWEQGSPDPWVPMGWWGGMGPPHISGALRVEGMGWNRGPLGHPRLWGRGWGVGPYGTPPSLTHPPPPAPTAGLSIPTSASYSKKTQAANAENKRAGGGGGEEEGGRRAGSTAKVPPSPLPSLERAKGTPSPSTVSMGGGGHPCLGPLGVGLGGPRHLGPLVWGGQGAPACLGPLGVGEGVSGWELGGVGGPNTWVPQGCQGALVPRQLGPPFGGACGVPGYLGPPSDSPPPPLCVCVPLHRTASSPPAPRGAVTPRCWTGPAWARAPCRTARTGRGLPPCPPKIPSPTPLLNAPLPPPPRPLLFFPSLPTPGCRPSPAAPPAPGAPPRSRQHPKPTATPADANCEATRPRQGRPPPKKSWRRAQVLGGTPGRVWAGGGVPMCLSLTLPGTPACPQGLGGI